MKAMIQIADQLRPALYEDEIGPSPRTHQVLVHPNMVDGRLMVEFDDGRLAAVEAWRIRFLDSEDLFSEYDWDAMRAYASEMDAKCGHEGVETC